MPHSTIVGLLLTTHTLDEYAVNAGFNTLIDNCCCCDCSTVCACLFVTIVYSDVIPAVRICSPIGLRWSVLGIWNLVCLQILTILISSCSLYLSAVFIPTPDLEMISFAFSLDSF